MPEPSLDSREWLNRLTEAARSTPIRPQVEQIGAVRRVGDGVALVEGLPEVEVGELVEFEDGTLGQVLDLDRELVGCALLGNAEGVTAGSQVVPAGRVVDVPVGPGVLGRVIDPLGVPLDDGGPIASANRAALDRDAPGPLQRQPVREPLFTGVKVVDAAVPIGKGQRELIMGDRETGKTSLALDTIINQRGGDVACVYVSIGAERAAVVEVTQELRRHDALAHTVVVVADAAQAPALRYLAPYAGASVAESFAYAGGHALVVYDDLTRHAEAYRSLALILRRPPGREAFPGDIFSIHAQLLERSFKLSEALGGGSVTALPIIETQRGNISEFIPTNLISITDGQLFLDAALFAQGQLPAVDLGRSVSRVGGDAQPELMRHAAASLRLEVAQYEDVRGFARFGALLDETTKRQLVRGERLMAALRQDERDVWPSNAQAAELWALRQGLLDDLSTDRVGRFEELLRGIARDFQPALEAAAGTQDALKRQLSELERWTRSALDRIRGDEHGR